ncbi:helix-turn-helix transcriptional regulator [Paraburkholderia sp. J12]|uniref:helix-turn-helix domain-containing protein n=1 Tax=Paraburkholderia sp. J12 TaxID=2805432 RepID=UPI002ABD3A02|nr:helix-turn-helix transcriptional regulator [Paraburkholderia sp. J12]
MPGYDIECWYMANVSDVGLRLGKSIAKERAARGWTQEQLAELLDVEQETVSRFERGLTLPPLPRLLQLADAFGIPVDALLRGTTGRAADAGSEIARLLESLDDENQDFVRRCITELCERLPHRKSTKR